MQIKFVVVVLIVMTSPPSEESFPFDQEKEDRALFVYSLSFLVGGLLDHDC